MAKGLVGPSAFPGKVLKRSTHVYTRTSAPPVVFMIGLISCEIELKRLIGDTGKLSSFVGGFEISVLDGELFPWEIVLEVLLALPHSVWVTRSDGSLVIKTKPPGF